MNAVEVYVAELGRTIRSTRSLGGGHGASVERVELDDGSTIVAKRSPLSGLGRLEEEARGLEALGSTGTVRTPTVHGVFSTGHDAALITEALTVCPATDQAWRAFGTELAALHDADARDWSGGSRYGFVIDNHLGATFQPNASTDDWCEFFADQRLRPLIEIAKGRGGGGSGLDAIARVADGLPSWLDPAPPPSVVHGDLWSGNAMAVEDGGGNSSVCIALIDPAPSVSDGLVDIAMMQLFGGFPSAVFDAYFRARPAPDDVERRLALYQLHHVLNHWVLFGSGYAGQAESLARRILAAR